MKFRPLKKRVEYAFWIRKDGESIVRTKGSNTNYIYLHKGDSNYSDCNSSEIFELLNIQGWKQIKDLTPFYDKFPGLKK